MTTYLRATENQGRYTVTDGPLGKRIGLADKDGSEIIIQPDDDPCSSRVSYESCVIYG